MGAKCFVVELQSHRMKLQIGIKNRGKIRKEGCKLQHFVLKRILFQNRAFPSPKTKLDAWNASEGFRQKRQSHMRTFGSEMFPLKCQFM